MINFFSSRVCDSLVNHWASHHNFALILVILSSMGHLLCYRLFCFNFFSSRLPKSLVNHSSSSVLFSCLLFSALCFGQVLCCYWWIAYTFFLQGFVILWLTWASHRILFGSHIILNTMGHVHCYCVSYFISILSSLHFSATFVYLNFVGHALLIYRLLLFMMCSNRGKKTPTF